jgi:hypothetical protein
MPRQRNQTLPRDGGEAVPRDTSQAAYAIVGNVADKSLVAGMPPSASTGTARSWETSPAKAAVSAPRRLRYYLQRDKAHRLQNLLTDRHIRESTILADAFRVPC